MKKRIILFTFLLIVTLFIFTDSSYAQMNFGTKSRDKKDSKKSSQSLPKLPPLKGPKKNIAVMDFENKAGVAAQWNLGSGMAEMLTTALVESGRFNVVERKAITDVLREQDFGASGRTTNVGAAKIGKILNAQVLIRGAVTEFDTRTSGGGNVFSFAGVDVGLSGSTAHVAVNVRMYDATTGEVIDSLRVEGKATSGGISGGYSGADLGGFNFGSSAFTKTPLGKATQKAINEAVYLISERMENIPWQGKIVTIKSDTVYINAGNNDNILAGSEFVIYRKGEDLIDPDTGISLGSEDTKIGRIQVVSVEDKFSKAKATSGSISNFKRGDIVSLD